MHPNTLLKKDVRKIGLNLSASGLGMGTIKLESKDFRDGEVGYQYFHKKALD